MKHLHINPYQKPTIELVLLLLEQAKEDELFLDQKLEEIALEVFKDIKKDLQKLLKQEKLDLSTKISLGSHPNLYRALKTIETEYLHKFVDWMWMGDQVIRASMERSYETALLANFSIYNRPVPNSIEITAIQQDKQLQQIQPQVRDTYIYNHYIKVPWCQDGKIYSDRLYGHVSQFQEKLAYVLEEGIENGKGMDWMMKSWMELTGSTAYDTARLLKTETMAMYSLATKSALLEMGVEYVEIVGDAMCGGICLDYVGEAVPLREAELGDLLPPYHPNCACSFVEYIAEVEADLEEEEEE